MDNELFRLMQEATPKLNKMLANGLATTQMPFVDQYIEDVIRAASRGTLEGLVFDRLARCEPKEEYLINIRRRTPARQPRRNPKKTYDMAETMANMYKLYFKFQGVPLEPRFVYLPFVGEAGSITINGSEFNIAPVLADRVISIGPDSIFVRLFCDRITFRRTSTPFVVNGKRETVQMVHSLIHHDSGGADESPAIKAETCMAHYLFCKHGFTGTFQKYAGFTPIISHYFDPVQFQEEEWMICESINLPMRGNKKIFGDPTKRQNIKIAVPKDKYTQLVKGLIAGFFYVADRFPSHVTIEHIENTRQWMIIMGYILFAASNGVGRLYDKMNSHMNSLDEYVDIITKANLHDIGVPVDTIYDFFAYIIEKFDEEILKGSDKVSTMYDKELSVLYYVMFDLIKNIFKFNFQLTAAAKKSSNDGDSTRRGLTQRDVESMLDRAFNPRLIHRIVKDHGEITSTGYSGDCKAFKITNQLVPQQNSTRSKGGRGGDRGSISDPSRQLHVSVAEVGAYSGMSKSDPSGRSRLNLCVRLNDKFVIERDPELRPLLDEVQEMISSS